MKKHDVGFWTHMYGNSIEYAHDHNLGLLGPRSVLSHCTGIPDRSIDIMRETGAHCAHHPRAARVYSYPGICPLPKLIDAGVTVALGADAPQNHDCDMFLDMKAAMRAQRLPMARHSCRRRPKANGSVTPSTINISTAAALSSRNFSRR